MLRKGMSVNGMRRARGWAHLIYTYSYAGVVPGADRSVSSAEPLVSTSSPHNWPNCCCLRNSGETVGYGNVERLQLRTSPFPIVFTGRKPSSISVKRRLRVRMLSTYK